MLHRSILPRRLGGMMVILVCGWLACGMTCGSAHGAETAELQLALANSTCEAMKQVGAKFQAQNQVQNQVQLTYHCKSSGLLAKGLQGGAIRADIFVSADREWMDFAVNAGLVARDKIVMPWGNSLSVAVPRGSALQLKDLADLASERVAAILIGDPSTAPFGRYAKEALEAAGLWQRVKAKVQTRKNIELLADSLAQADTDTVGILFSTHVDHELRLLLPVDPGLHKPIHYYVAPLANAANPELAQAFLKFLDTRAATDIFRAARFDLRKP